MTTLMDLKIGESVEDIYLERLMFVKRFSDYKKIYPSKTISEGELKAIIEILEQLPSTLNNYIANMKNKLDKMIEMKK